MTEPTRVCVIDDDDLICDHIAALLTPAGYEVVCADSAKAGLALIAEHRPDVVLVDIIMPDKDGVEVIAEIRRLWPDLRIVAMSAGGQVGPTLYLQIAQTMGAHACLTKPLSLTELTEALAG